MKLFLAVNSSFGKHVTVKWINYIMVCSRSCSEKNFLRKLQLSTRMVKHHIPLT